eukprot:CAMPEP_0171857094 /NCGR_PEP_ID=MMETSP0992-20121227/24476_1 /TAXON_ID=483369 /ORGANISM="non described non described, Strain CCMP2098" /LENGTH=189 /DNA_ID=CAMNT_0012478247 /DNA_START=112 /DNA_END=677 /DNA_ORIENTATION=+
MPTSATSRGHTPFYSDRLQGFKLKQHEKFTSGKLAKSLSKPGSPIRLRPTSAGPGVERKTAPQQAWAAYTEPAPKANRPQSASSAGRGGDRAGNVLNAAGPGGAVGSNTRLAGTGQGGVEAWQHPTWHNDDGQLREALEKLTVENRRMKEENNEFAKSHSQVTSANLRLERELGKVTKQCSKLLGTGAG